MSEVLNTKNPQTSLIIDKDNILVVITHEDVEQNLLSSEVVRNLDEGLGIKIGPFINGVAEVSWRLKPYEYYEIDYGVPGWGHDCIAYAMIDANGKFLEKFQYTDYHGLKEMRERAEKMVSETNSKPNLFKDFFVELTPEEIRARRIPGDPRDYDDAFIEALEENAKKMRNKNQERTK